MSNLSRSPLKGPAVGQGGFVLQPPPKLRPYGGIPCWCDGIGILDGLKIRCVKARVGSTPTTSTKKLIIRGEVFTARLYRPDKKDPRYSLWEEQIINLYQ